MLLAGRPTVHLQDTLLDGVPDPHAGEGKIWGVKPPAKICNSNLLLPPGEYKRLVAIPLYAKSLWTSLVCDICNRVFLY